MKKKIPKKNKADVKEDDENANANVLLFSLAGALENRK